MKKVGWFVFWGVVISAPVWGSGLLGFKKPQTVETYLFDLLFSIAGTLILYIVIIRPFFKKG